MSDDIPDDNGPRINVIDVSVTPSGVQVEVLGPRYGQSSPDRIVTEGHPTWPRLTIVAKRLADTVPELAGKKLVRVDNVVVTHGFYAGGVSSQFSFQ